MSATRPTVTVILLCYLLENSSPWMIHPLHFTVQTSWRQQINKYKIRFPWIAYIGSTIQSDFSSRSLLIPNRVGRVVLFQKQSDDDVQKIVDDNHSKLSDRNITQSNNKSTYDLGLWKNKPLDRLSNEKVQPEDTSNIKTSVEFWKAPEPVAKPFVVTNTPTNATKFSFPKPRRIRRMVARDNSSQKLRAAMWDELHYNDRSKNDVTTTSQPIKITSTTLASDNFRTFDIGLNCPKKPVLMYPDIDLSIPESVYSDDGSIDVVWDLLRWEAFQNQQSQREPLLVSFMHSTILNHPSLESSLSFLLANRLQSPAIMISTQLQSLIYEALQSDKTFRRKLRADIMAVRDRDPACNTLPDVFLYFKGFHALQSHRVANVLWKTGRQVLAQYLQSQVSQTFQIDIHPNATLGSGIMLDHGTGIVIGETATLGNNCSILHHVTLGGSGKKGVVRHPNIGSGVLLGAGATVLGPVKIGDGSQVGAGTLVISDLPAHCVAVGVPARIIGSFIDVTEQPSIGMNQIMDQCDSIITFESDGI